VAFEGTVTYYRSYERTLFVQDDDLAIFVNHLTDAKVSPGDRILIRGTTRANFTPYVNSDSITVLRRVPLPTPVSASFDQLIRAQFDCRLVTTRGIIHTIDFTVSALAPVRSIRMQVLADGGYINVNVDSDDAGSLEDLLDAEVELTGIGGETFDGKMQQTGVLMHIQTLANVKILKRASTSPWSLPLTSMDRVLAVSHTQDSTPRVRVHGTITYYEPGVAVVLQDGNRSIWVATQTRIPLRIGDAAGATGFPVAQDGFLRLAHGEIRDRFTPAPVTPLEATWSTLSPSGFERMGHHYDLVSIEGRVVAQVQEASQEEFVLSADGKLFSAFLGRTENPLQEAKPVPVGASIRVTGICIRESANPFIANVPFRILMRSIDDITVVANPSPLNIRNLILAVGMLLLLVFAALTRAWGLERKVRQKTAALAVSVEAEAAHERNSAQLEQKRSHILEDINGSRPLEEILLQITEMASFMLDGVPCWCEIGGEAMYGNRVADVNGHRVERASIHARSGPALGTLFAAFDPAKPVDTRETIALSNGARLAALAIETRRLYADLRRRSEFDLLTDIPNRFAMQQRLDLLITEAQRDQTIFGLIFIDLDKFKPINDRYGHHIGDLYLQEVARRMQQQLREGDMLARLGGDEFAALISKAPTQTHIEEVVRRIELSFDTPFIVEGFLLRGTASVGIALYPEDGTTKDKLLNVADARMYVAKNDKRKREESQLGDPPCEVSA